jgi:hypothetical protein
MRILALFSTGCLLLVAGCGRVDSPVSNSSGTSQGPAPATPDAASATIPMPDFLVSPDLPSAINETTTRGQLEIHATIVAHEEYASRFWTLEQIPQRISDLMAYWLPQMEAYQQRIAMSKADKARLAAWELEQAKIIAKWQAETAALDRRQDTVLQEAQLKQIRLISAATYERLHNLGQGFGCRTNAARP